MNQPRLIWDGVRVKGDRPLEFWYVRRSFAAAKVAVEKGMIPIFGILNQTYSNWIKSQNDALEFQEANGGCTIAMVQQFWGRETTAECAWNPKEWSRFVGKRLPDAVNRIMMIDVEPMESSLHAMVTTVRDGTLGIAGSPDQVRMMLEFVASQPKYAFAFPELRDNPMNFPRTTPGSIYAIFSGLGVRGMNEATYTPGSPAAVGDTVIGLRMSATPKIYHYTPENAKAAYPGLDRFYFPNTTVETEELDIVKQL